jgi:hypothetical protein
MPKPMPIANPGSPAPKTGPGAAWVFAAEILVVAVEVAVWAALLSGGKVNATNARDKAAANRVCVVFILQFTLV